MHLAQVLQERLDHLAFGTGADAVDDLDQEIDQAVDDLLAPLPAKRGDQGIAHRLGMPSQFAGAFPGGTDAVLLEHLRAGRRRTSPRASPGRRCAGA